MPNKSRKQKSNTYFKSKTKTKSKFTGGKNIRRSKIRKKGRVTKHVGGEWKWPWNWFKKTPPASNTKSSNETFENSFGKPQKLDALDGKKVQYALKQDPTKFKGNKFTKYGYGNNEHNNNKSNTNTISTESNNYSNPLPSLSNKEKKRLTNEAKENYNKFSTTYEINKQKNETFQNKEQKEKEESNRIAQEQKNKKKEEALKCLENIDMKQDKREEIKRILESA